MIYSISDAHTLKSLYKPIAADVAAALIHAQTKRMVDTMLAGADHRRAVISALSQGRKFSVTQASDEWTGMFIQGRA